MAEEFTCAVDEIYRSACKDLPKYSGSRYCVLHEPDEAKNKEDFLKVKKSKLDRKDYDFGGAVFPEGTSNFKRYEFDANVAFTGADFIGTAAFSNVHFSGDTDFSGAHFSGERASFSGAIFSGNASYSGAIFSGDTAFSDTHFNGELTDFSSAEFSGERTYFLDTHFSGHRASFSGAHFTGDTYFESHFSGEHAYFSGARFMGELTHFSNVHFSGDTDFSGAHFTSERTDFRGAHFTSEHTSFEPTDFSGAHFSGDTDFSGVPFSGDLTDFSGAHFSGEHTSFGRSQFSSERTDFSGAHFRSKETSFQGASFVKEAYFTQATFEERAFFWGSKGIPAFASEAGAWFDSVRIEKPELLSFYSVLLHPGWFINTDVRKVEFTDVQWYGMPGGPKGTLKKEIEALQKKRDAESPHTLLAQTCRRLSANAEENREYPLANEFHYWSMDALRKAGWSRLGLIGRVYWALSGYGVRAARAFWILFGMWAAFTALYVLVDPSEFKEFGKGIGYLWQAAVYSLLAMARLNPEPRPDEPGLFQFLVGLEGILGPLQIALLALAIRRQVMR